MAQPSSPTPPSRVTTSGDFQAYRFDSTAYRAQFADVSAPEDAMGLDDLTGDLDTALA